MDAIIALFYLAAILGAAVLVFWACRRVVLWYFRINEAVALLRRIADAVDPVRIEPGTDDDKASAE